MVEMVAASAVAKETVVEAAVEVDTGSGLPRREERQRCFAPWVVSGETPRYSEGYPGF